jgi:serine protease Do
MPSRAQGSGFVFSIDKGLLSDKAYILTNHHVVEHAEKIRVKLQDGREFDAKVKGADPRSDIAVLEVSAKNLPALSLGDSNKLEVGEWVIALGNPFGLSHTLTVGVVSAKGRTSVGLSDYEDFIQTDAAINPGNSGGPLVNLNGEVVGINTAIFSRSGGYMGIGFAIPVNLARGIAEQLLQNGEVTRGYLGVYIQTLTPELADGMDLKGRQGILISKVNPDTPAEKAGIKQGDVVISYQDQRVEEVGDFRNKVALTLPGTKAKLKLIRDGDEIEKEVTIGQLDDAKVAGEAGTESADQLGLTVQTLTPELAENFNVEAGRGVVVTQVEPGSVANMAGIRPGTLILEVNRQPVNNAIAFKKAIKASGKKRALLLLQRDGMTQFAVLSW